MTEGKRYKSHMPGYRVSIPGRRAIEFDAHGLWPAKADPPCVDEDVQEYLEGHRFYRSKFIDVNWKPEPVPIKNQAAQISMALAAAANIPGIKLSSMPKAKPELPTLKEVHYMKKKQLIELAEKNSVRVDITAPYRILKQEMKDWLKSQEV